MSICWTDNDSFEPSDRELDNLGYTREDWDNNIEIDNGWGGKSPIKECELIDFSHFESQDTYLDALKIINAINNG